MLLSMLQSGYGLKIRRIEISQEYPTKLPNMTSRDWRTKDYLSQKEKKKVVTTWLANWLNNLEMKLAQNVESRIHSKNK